MGQPAVKTEKRGGDTKLARKMMHLCRYCNGQHWDNKCPTRRVHFATTNTNNNSDNKVDLDVLEHLTDDLNNPVKN